MNPCLSWGLADSKSTSFPCIDSYETAKDEDQNGEQVQNYAQNFMFHKETEKSVKLKRCISTPGKARVYYKREQPMNSTSSQADEMKYRQKGFLSEHAFPNEPKLTRSTEKLKEFLLTHADFLDSLYEKHKNSNNEQPSERKALPGELWWVPPLKIPTSRSVPSVAMSNSFSAASSTSTHPRTRRSVEDLRQRVDSVCELVEAMGIIETEQQTSRSVGLGIPLLQIPSTAASQTSSRGGSEELKPHTSYKTVASQCTVIEPQQLTDHINNQNTNNNTGSPTLRMTSNSSSPAPEYITSTSPANKAIRVASRQDTCSRYDQPQSSLSVSDLACIHIVNPMLSKLARLCTAQGQQYLNVLEELEKACNDFHNACKFQGVTK